MSFKQLRYAVASTILLQTAIASAITISNPKAHSTVDKNNLTVVVTGSCVKNLHVKLDGTDSAKKITPLVWAMCTNAGSFWAQVNISALKDGAVKIRAFQVVRNRTQEVSVSVLKQVESVTPAVALKFEAPAAGAIIDQANLKVVLAGSCIKGNTIKFDATDVNKKVTETVWSMCPDYQEFWATIDLSSLADGAISLRAYHVINGVNQSAVYQNVVKKTSVVVAPSPTPSPSPSPSPTVVPTPVPSPSPSPSPIASGMVIGVNGHDGVQAYYPLSQAEARFKILDARNLRSYRFDLVPGRTDVLNTLIPLAKKYNITLRPMLYPTTQAAAYNFVKLYAKDINVWEIGNEQDYSKSGAQERINVMVTTYKGIKQASDETGTNLKTTINVMACNSDDVSATARCPNDKLGAMWFLDMAKASGFNFDYISFHYYPFFSDKGYWMNMYFTQMRAMATKYKTQIFYNEMNCADIYQGNTDGGYAGDKACYDSMKQMFEILRSDYSDIVKEVNVYEMLNEPDHQVTHERNFGLMYDLNNPKKLLDLVTEYANKK